MVRGSEWVAETSSDSGIGRSVNRHGAQRGRRRIAACPDAAKDSKTASVGEGLLK